MRTKAFIYSVVVTGLTIVALDLCETFIPAPPIPVPPVNTNAPIATATATFPVEVLGPPDSTVDVAFVITNATTATDLYFKIHSPGEGKIALSVNGGAFVAFTSNNIVQARKQLAFWGLKGIQYTVEFTAAATNWTLVDAPATNTFTFKFIDYTGLTIGYRVLDFNTIHSSTNLIAETQFTRDNPATWIPSTNAASIAAGRTAWYTLPITENGAALLANCTSCHFEDGGDLKLLNYSAKSIIMRSQFHGVPLVTATNIANYISSLSYPYMTNGRPWNPPYQPWAGADSVDPVYWFAGGGLDSVLTTDTNTLTYLFPSPITTNSIDFDNTVSARTTPLAFQFPDWNHWLPRVHPLDQTPPLAATNAYLTIYSTLRTNIFGKTATQQATLINAQKSNWDRAGQTMTKPYPFTYSAHWRITKTCELMNGLSGAVQDQGVALFGAASDNRRWFHGEVFRVGPHVLGSPKINTFYAESMQWYQVQLVLNSGNRLNGGIVPIDWGYQIPLNRSAWNNDENYPQYASQMLNQIKAGEVVSNGLPPDNDNGWDLVKVNLGYMTGNATLYNQIDLATRRALAGSLLTAWLEQSERWTTNQYYASPSLKTTNQITSMSNTLAAVTSSYTTLGVDPNVMSRFLAFRQFLFP